MKIRPSFIRIPVLFLLLLLSGFQSRAATFTVNMQANQFSPKTLTVNVGDTVTWINRDFAAHDTVSGQSGIGNGVWRSALLNNNQTFSFTFNVAAGSYPYYCTPHWSSFNMVGTITVNAAANNPPAVTITSPANGATFTAPTNITILATATDADGSVAQVEFFNGSTSLGVDTSSPYSATASNLAAGTYTLSAVATDNLGAKRTNSVNVTVTAPVNNPPTVTITSPASGATFTAPANVTIQATASDTDGSVTQVEFFNGNSSLGVDTGSPYSADANNLAAGSYTFSAVATDNLGAKRTNSVSVTVTPAANVPPSVSITSPTNGATFTAPANIAIAASAADSDGNVTQVEFFNGGASLGASTSSPYSVTVSNLNPGTYTISAVATDNSGGRATNSISISVNPPPNAPLFVTITTPINGSVFTAPANVPIEATTTDTNNTVTGIEFFLNGASLGIDTSVPFTSTAANLMVGSHTIAAIATDNQGARATNSVVISVVAPNRPPQVVVTSPTNGAIFSAAANVMIEITAFDGDGAISQVEFLVNGVSLAIDRESPYSATASNLLQGSYTIAAVATDNLGATSTNAVTITVNPSAPTVSITSPRKSAILSAPATVNIEAVASDPDGSVSQVEFFLDGTKFGSNGGPNGTPSLAIVFEPVLRFPPAAIVFGPILFGPILIGVDTDSPYQATAENLLAGQYRITAIATDNTGLKSTNSVTFRVSPSSPSVRITNPTNGSQLAAAGVQTLDAEASDADGTIVQVEFFENGISRGIATNSPYSIPVTLSSGTHTISAVATDNQGLTATNSITFNATVELILQHSSGYLVAWTLNQTNLTQGQFLNNLPSVGTLWRIAAVDDLNGDGHDDFLWQQTDGSLAVWYMDGTNLISGELLGLPQFGRAWRIVGLADLNGDGHLDFIWQHTLGYLAVWFMEGTSLMSAELLNHGQPVTGGWQIVGFKDLNGDGHIDFLWQQSDGYLAVWYMDGTNLLGGELLSTPATGPDWKIVGLEDFNNDGNTDFLWQRTDGLLAVWYMNRVSLIGGALLPTPAVGRDWRVVGAK